MEFLLHAVGHYVCSGFCRRALRLCVLAGADGRDALRLVDDQTFETLDRFTLDAYELTCSLTSLQFAEDPKWYYVMGTAYAHPDEDEPSKVSNAEWISGGRTDTRQCRCTWQLVR